MGRVAYRPVPSFRLRFFAPVVVLVFAAACGGNNSAIGGSGSASTAPKSTTTAPPVSNGTLKIVPVSWTLPFPISREVLLTDGHLLVGLGGLNEAKVSSPAVFSIDPTSGAAKALGMLPQARADLAAAVVDNTAYVMAGSQESQSFFLSVLASTDGATWRAAGNITTPVRYPAIAAANGAVYLFGGVTSNGTDTAAVQRYDPKTGATTVIAQLPAPTAHASAVALGNSIYVLGGIIGNTVSSQVLRVDIGTGAVTPAGSLPAPLSDAAVATIGPIAYLAGGQGPSSAPVSTVYALALSNS